MSKKLSSKQIDQIKLRLLSDAKEAEARMHQLKKNDPFLDPDHANDNAAVDTDIREQVDHETIQAQITALQKRIHNIQLALKKLDSSKYGICESCGKEIPVERLDLVPEARYCIECERRLIK